MHAPYQVGLTIDGSQLISEHVASAVSRAVGGNGEVELVDSWDIYKLWMIDLTEPFDGEVEVVDENGFTRTVVVETPMP